MKYLTYQKGLSLVEVIVYVAILAFLAVVIINSFIVVLGSFDRTRTNRDLLENANVSLERMSREIRGAQSIDTAGSTLGSSPGVLDLNSTNSDGSARSVTFSVSNGDLNLTQDGVLTGNLLGQNVSVTSLVFRQVSTDLGEGVKIEMTLRDDRGKDHKTENFYDTVMIRGSY